MTALAIGRGMYRVNVHSGRARRELAKTPGVRVLGDAVYFPERLYDAVARYLDGPKNRKRAAKPEQMAMEV